MTIRLAYLAGGVEVGTIRLAYLAGGTPSGTIRLAYLAGSAATVLTVSAGAAQSPNSFDTVTLTGSVSGGAYTSAAWSLKSTTGPEPDLTGTGLQVTYTAPAVLEQNTVLTWQLTVMDGAATYLAEVVHTIPRHQFWSWDGSVLSPRVKYLFL